MIFVNFKTYKEGTGINALHLAKIIEEVAHETGIKMVVVVQALDIREVCQNSKVEVWSQKIDPVEFGAHTGAILAEAVFEDGAQGTFLNHSENKMKDINEIKMGVERASVAGLKTLVFAGEINELKQIANLCPTYVSYEPPELIGSTSISVSQAKPELIKEAAEFCKSRGIPLIVGAGIHKEEDVRRSVELGASGIAVATNIVKSENPRDELLNLAGGFQ